MSTLQKNLTQVRELANEELDLVGGALTGCMEVSFFDTSSVINVTSNGQTWSLIVTDDKLNDTIAD